MLRILDTPSALRSGTIGYPAHSRGPNIEEAFYAYAVARQTAVVTELVYLPIFWQNNYFSLNRRTREIGYRADPTVQQFLDGHLQRHLSYFTVTQADEAAYERLPPNVLVFAGAGAGHIPLALICDPHPTQDVPRDILASFVGNIETGGPVTVAGRPGQSSWDHDGAGARVRRAMQQRLQQEPGFQIYNQKGGSPAAIAHFRDITCRSKFVLCPRGYGKTSFRLFEAMQLGAVPVVIYDVPWLPYTDSLDWSEFSVLVHVADIPHIPRLLAAHNADDWQRKADRIRELWPTHFSTAGACQQILNYVADSQPAVPPRTRFPRY